MGYSSSETGGFSYSAKGGLNMSFSASVGRSSSKSTSESESESRSTSAGVSESVQKRPLITPDEVGRMFGDTRDPAALVLVSGQQPIAVRRVEYFRDRAMRGYYDTHPDHPSPPMLMELAAEIEQEKREAAMKIQREAEVARQQALRQKAWQDEQARLALEKAREDAKRNAIIAFGRSELARLRAEEKQRRQRLVSAAIYGTSGLAFAGGTGLLAHAWRALWLLF